MIELLKTLSPGYLVAVILSMVVVIKVLVESVAWFFRDYWSDRKALLEKRDKSLTENTTAIIKLEIRLESITKLLELVPKMKADIDWAHEKIREIRNEQSS